MSCTHWKYLSISLNKCTSVDDHLSECFYWIETVFGNYIITTTIYYKVSIIIMDTWCYQIYKRNYVQCNVSSTALLWLNTVIAKMTKTYFVKNYIFAHGHIVTLSHMDLIAYLPKTSMCNWGIILLILSKCYFCICCRCEWYIWDSLLDKYWVL